MHGSMSRENVGYGGVSLAMTGFGDFIFQAMFAATAATIVSGAVAERVKLSSFMVFATHKVTPTLCVCLLVWYP